MPTVNLYNHTVGRFVTGLNAAADTYKVILLNASGTFVATHTTSAHVTSTGANDIEGNGWAVGGYTLQSVTLATVTTNDAAFDAADVAQAISGGDLGPIYAYAIVNTTDDAAVMHVLLDAAVTVTNGNICSIPWAADGIIKFSV